MRRYAVLWFFLFWCASLAYASSDTQPVSGIWQGKVHVQNEDLRIVLHIIADAGGLPAATLDSPDTGKLAIALQSVKTDESSISFDANDLKLSFEGALKDGELTGEWKQNAQSVSVKFTRLAQAPKFDQDGSYLFHSQCTSCHTPFNPVRAPWPGTLKLMMQSAILMALESGKMSAVGGGMSHEQRVAVANYLGRPETEQSTHANACGASSVPTNSASWNGWGVDLSNSRFQPADSAGLSKSQVSRLRVKWAFGYPGATTAGGPATIVGGRIYVAGGDGRIYSLDIRSGCVYWTFLPSALVRTAITISADGSTAYFGDMQGRAYGIDAHTGILIWKTDLDPHPFAMITGAPRLYAGRLYVPVSSAEELGGANPKYPCCTFRGSINSLDAKTGSLVWKTYTIPTAAQSVSTNGVGTAVFGPSGAGVWNSPTIDPHRGALYVGTGDNYSDPASATSDAVMALNLETGKILWTKQLTSDDRFNIGCLGQDKSSCPKNPGGDFDIGAPPILRTLKNGKRLLLVGQKSGVAYGLDPDDAGSIVWQTRIGKGGPLGGIEFGGAANDTQVYYPLSDWEPNPKAGGGMFALDIASGKKLWSAPAAPPDCVDKEGCGASQQAPATAIPGIVFSGSLDGHIRAYDAVDGKIVWDFNTARDFQTVNGLEAHGGSINYAGPIVAGGMVFVTSGYSFNSGMPGNVLLAFSEDGK